VFARPPWFTFLPTILLFVIVFVFSLVLEYVVATREIGSLQTSNLIILGLGIFQLFALTVFLVSVLDFYYDLLIVTDQRLVDIDQQQLFYRKFSQLNLENVEDVNAVLQGFFQMTLNFGTIQVQTAGEQENFIIHNLKHPNEIVGIISSLSKQAKENIPDAQRVPETRAVAVISDRLITDPTQLAGLGAMVPDDIRLRRGTYADS